MMPTVTVTDDDCIFNSTEHFLLFVNKIIQRNFTSLEKNISSVAQ